MTPVARMPNPARTCRTRDRGSSRAALPHSSLPRLVRPGAGVRSCFWRTLSQSASTRAVSRAGQAPTTRPAAAAASSKASASSDQSAFHRWPSLFHLAFIARPACARPASTRLPGAALRLLQSNTIREHDLEPTEPRCLAAPGGAFPCGTRQPRVFESGIQRAALTGLDAAITLRLEN